MSHWQMVCVVGGVHLTPVAFSICLSDQLITWESTWLSSQQEIYRFVCQNTDSVQLVSYKVCPLVCLVGSLPG